MRNLEQIRAKNALTHENETILGENKGEVVKKVPSLIMDNGILATAAFAKEAGKGHQKVFECVIEHLRDQDVAKIDSGIHSLDDFLSYSTTIDSAKLREITAETMAYLNYLRRFVRKK